jgi:hypothetical protein
MVRFHTARIASSTYDAGRRNNSQNVGAVSRFNISLRIRCSLPLTVSRLPAAYLCVVPCGGSSHLMAANAV